MTLKTSDFLISDDSLEKKDNAVYQILRKEQRRQYEGLELIASEVGRSPSLFIGKGLALH
jgi:glycine/serine hydroxymethyltransferase